jgi:hypothetical protein
MARRGGPADGVLALGLLLALAAGLAALGALGTRGADPFEVRRSTFLATPTGAKAVHDSMQELGFRVARQRASLREVPAGTATLLVLSPPVAMAQEEVRGILSWVDAGGTLVLALGGGSMPATASAANWETPQAALAREIGVRARSTPVSQYGIAPTAAVEALFPGRERIERLRFHGGRVLEGPLLGHATYRPLVRSALYGDIVGTARRGRGRIVVFADDAPFTNRSVRHPDNALFLLRICAPRAGEGAILFDERHQGYGDDRGAASRLAGALAETGLGLAVLQAGLAGVVLLYLGGRRFGAPLPPPAAARRSAAEAAEALGRAYDAAGATGLSAETLATTVRRRAAARFGIPPTLPPAEFTRRLRASKAADGAALADALDSAAAVRDGGRGEGAALVAAARALDAAVAEKEGRRA